MVCYSTKMLIIANCLKKGTVIDVKNKTINLIHISNAENNSGRPKLDLSST